MKKILLLDDNLYDYRKSCGADFVDAGIYDDVMKSIDKICLDDDISGYLKNAQCILMHSSLSDFINGTFQKDSHLVRDYILEDYSDFGKNVPIVLFSDGDSEVAEYYEPNIIRKIRKKTFYARLEDFLLDFRENNTINLSLLAFGKDYAKIEVRRCALALAEKLSGLSGELDNDTIDIICGDELYSIVDLSNPELGLSYDDLLNQLEDAPISVDTFKSALQRIVKSFNQYGRNVYPWDKLIS